LILKSLLRLICLAGCLATGLWGSLFGQVCLVDSQYTSPGIYPSDTLPDMQANVPYDEVVQLVIAPDTVLFGFTLVWDSIRVVSMANLPSSVNWNCNVNNCRYQGNGVDPFRLCLRLTGTPIDTSLGMPGWDSTIVGVEMYITTPFGNNPSFVGFPIYYRKGQLVGIGIERMPTPELKVNPNPVTDAAWVTFEMQRAGNVHFSLSDAFGREVRKITRSDLAMGNQKILLEIDDLPSGLYFLRVASAEGLTAMQRIVKL
jgi:hypothetical protein